MPAYDSRPTAAASPATGIGGRLRPQPGRPVPANPAGRTSYFSGQVDPALGVFYDWGGAVVAQPQVTLSRDPFRFTISYSYLYASTLKGGSGISLLRDRDNVLFQFEYVI